MKKRNLIALLMAVCMMFSLLPVNAIAVGDEGTIPAEETLLSENGNDSAPAGSTNPAGDKDSIRTQAISPVRRKSLARTKSPRRTKSPARTKSPRRAKRAARQTLSP